MKTKTQLSNEEMFSQLLQRHGNAKWNISNNLDIVNSHTKSFGLANAAQFGILLKHSRGIYSIPEKSVPNTMAAILRERCRLKSSENNQKKKIEILSSIQFPIQSNSIAPTLEYCISRVKEAGYKVMKPTTEYKEI
jgi:hypothetical protein